MVIEAAIMPMNSAREATGWLVTKSSMMPAMEKTTAAMPIATGMSSHQSILRRSSLKVPFEIALGRSVMRFADSIRRP